MKAFLLFLTVLATYFLISLPAAAQIEKGTRAIGLTFGLSERTSSFGSLSSFTNTNRSLFFYPEYAYFFRDRISIISGAGYNRSLYNNESRNGDSGESRLTDFTVFSGLRIHVPLQPKLYLITTYGPKYQYRERQSRYTNSGAISETFTEEHDFGLFGNAGLAFFPSNRWSLELILAESSLSMTHHRSLQQEKMAGYANTWKFTMHAFLDQPNLALRYYFK